jgi:hypothetical protein
LEQELAVEVAANEAYEEFRETGRDSLGRRPAGRPKPYTAPTLPQGTVNVSDPDSRLMHDKGQTKVQGYNAQAAVTTGGQIIVAAEITVESPDFGHLEPVFDAAVRDLKAAGVSERPGTALADAGYWHGEQSDAIVAGGTRVLIPPDSGKKEKPRAGWTGGRYDFMRAVLATDQGQQLYQQRARSIEPVFGQIKHNRAFRQFRRRGRAAVRSEWRLIAATHNLLKLHQHWIAPATP